MTNIGVDGVDDLMAGMPPVSHIVGFKQAPHAQRFIIGTRNLARWVRLVSGDDTWRRRDPLSQLTLRGSWLKSYTFTVAPVKLP